MHHFKSSASPYLCEVTLDVSDGFGARDVKTFEGKAERGVAVFGYTPNVLLVAKSEYQKWESVGKLLLVLNTGKVAICDSGITDSLISLLRDINPSVQLKVFQKSQNSEARSWLLT
jgi:hypothetical protein